MSGLEEQITKINKLIEKYTNEIKGFNEKITEYNNKPPSTINSNSIARFNEHINLRKKTIKNFTQQIKALREMKKKVDRGVTPVEEQKIQLPGNTIPTPDENYIKRPSTEEEERGVKPVKEEERGVKPVKEEKMEKPVKEEKMEKPVKEEGGVKPVEADLYSSGITQKNRAILPIGTLKPVTSRNIPVNAGFSETIVPNQNISTGLGPKRPNMKLCPQIFDIGKKVNNKFFIPSQFPNLTKKKSLIKGGSKHMKTKGSNRKVISRKGFKNN